MKRNGFTLVELLGVIAILALIVVVVAPPIVNQIKKARTTFDEATLNLIYSATDSYVDNNQSDYPIVNDNVYCISLATLVESGELKESVIDIDKNNEIPLDKIVKVTISNNLYDYNLVDIDQCEYYYFPYNYSKSVNEPQLVTGMTPIKWDGTTWIETEYDDPDWYNYTATDKKWANARTADGSFWVWIPRYIYKISSGWHTSTTGTIDIQFSIGTDDTIGGTVSLADTGSANDSNGTWTSHPAFTFGSSELPGIWVAKFEPTASEGVANSSTGDNVTTKTVKIIPNAQSWRYITIGNSFTVIRKMETNSVYGWGTTGKRIDTHLIKNTEWGALIYLAKSIYGKNTVEIWKNPADNYTTGCAGTTATSTATVGCLYTYETANGLNASTTGNIYGVYDVAGCAWERVAAYVSNGNSALNTYGSAIINADSKYKNVYTAGAADTRDDHYALMINQKGDAIYETSLSGNGSTSWFTDYSYGPATGGPWFRRGGYNGNNNSYGGVFGFYDTGGTATESHSFRPVLAVNIDL